MGVELQTNHDGCDYTITLEDDWSSAKIIFQQKNGDNPKTHTVQLVPPQSGRPQQTLSYISSRTGEPVESVISLSTQKFDELKQIFVAKLTELKELDSDWQNCADHFINQLSAQTPTSASRPR